MEIEDAIKAAFPLDTPEHNTARKAVLAAYISALNAEDALSRVGRWIAGIIEDPPEGIFNQILPETCAEAAKKLELAAIQLRVSAKQIALLKPTWTKFQQ